VGNELGQLLAAFRSSAGLSQEELADASGVSASTISDIERGVSRAPRYSTLRTLADALEMPAQERARLLAAARPSLAGTDSDASHVVVTSVREADGVPLAEALARLRARAELSIPDLAASSGLSSRTIHNVEKGKTRRVQPETARLLADALTLKDTERENFLALAVGGSVPSTGIRGPAGPALLRGRVREYEDLLTLVGEHRLVTITGPGGIGKTALAIAAAQARRGPVRLFEFAELEPGSDTTLGMARLAGLDDGPREELLSKIAGDLPGDCLLVLDNLEHLAGADVAVTGLLGARPDIRVLATSRVTLGIAQEHPLPLGALDQDAARTLFGDIAKRAGRPVPDSTDPAIIARICARLDGLPLAIELAASWSAILTPQDILAQLDHPGRLLKRPDSRPGRQASVSDTVDWSLRLLPAGAVTLFWELSVYPASWPLHVIEAVHPTRDVLDCLHKLTAFGLVRADMAGPTASFRMLQTVHDAAQSVTGADPSLIAGVLSRHAGYLTDRAVALAPDFITPRAAAAHEQIRADYLHYESALRYLTATADQRALELSAALWRYWQSSGTYRAGLTMIRAALTACTCAEPTLVARSRYAAAVLAHIAGDNELATSEALDALPQLRKVADAERVGAVMSLLGMISLHSGRITEAIHWYQDGLSEVTWEAGPHSHMVLLTNFASVRAAEGNLAAAISLTEDAAIRCQLLGDPTGIATQLGNLAIWSAQAGDVERARDLLNEARQKFQEVRDPAGLREVYQLLTGFALNEGDAAAASEALSMADQYGAELDDPYGDILAACYAAELLLHSGNLVAAVHESRSAAVRAGSLNWQPGAVRALLVQAVGLARQGNADEAAQAARSGLELCSAADAAAIATFSVVVCAVHAGHPDASRLADATRSLAAQPGAAPHAMVKPLSAVSASHEPPADAQVTATQVRGLALEICG
jgi:predicted ATPase